SCAIVLIVSLAVAASAFEWTALGPDGGDARSLAYDPQNPDRIFMGTMAGKLFFSSDAGAHWVRLAHLGGDDYVLDSVAVDPADSNRIYVAGWSVNSDTGDLFRTTDGGKTWTPLQGMRGKSVRAMALAPSNSKIVAAVALDGVYRSLDGGDSWQLISPPRHAEIRNLQSVAIDPQNPDVIYVGTWHLPWKTGDGGKSWESIKKGIIDDSDVFSIIIDPRNPAVVYASACSGIYKSENAGALFHKVQGMPFSARRTRVLRMDPADSNTVYAGTTEGLWKTTDGGKSFKRMTAPNVVVNGIVIDPRHSERMLLATDRGGVLATQNAAVSFSASNRGFTHRQVASVLLGRDDPNTIYAGLINDHEFGGVFVSRDGGASWQQMSAGLDGRDVFSLRQTASNVLVAGTNRGIFEWKASNYRWEPINTVLSEKEVMVKPATKRRPAVQRSVISHSELGTRVNDVWVNGETWFAATPHGLFNTLDQGREWRGGQVAGQDDFVAVRTHGPLVAAASHSGVAVSLDSGSHWYAANLPYFVTHVHDIAIGAENTLWIATRQGLFRSETSGDTWEHVFSGLPATHVNSISYDADRNRLLATSTATEMLYESTDGGYHWHPAGDSGWEVRGVATSAGKLLVTTAYDGILAEAERPAATASVAANSGSSSAAASAPR
ncbi:MAG TPA: hypothetical protein VGR50_08855, partial [Terriglobales bacterium]|nr:hypothetical protein [Terriglobales bacterium]